MHASVLSKQLHAKTFEGKNLWTTEINRPYSQKLCESRFVCMYARNVTTWSHNHFTTIYRAIILFKSSSDDTTHEINDSIHTLEHVVSTMDYTGIIRLEHLALYRKNGHFNACGRIICLMIRFETKLDKWMLLFCFRLRWRVTSRRRMSCWSNVLLWWTHNVFMQVADIIRYSVDHERVSRALLWFLSSFVLCSIYRMTPNWLQVLSCAI